MLHVLPDRVRSWMSDGTIYCVKVAALLEAAQSTADPQKAEELTQRAAVLISLVDELDALDGSDITLH